MRHLTAADFIATRWRNGAGAVTQLAIHPPGATLESFIWRVSMATVAADGPFSCFAGVDRSLAVLSGEGLALHMAGGTRRIVQGDAPLRFAADMPVEASLLGGVVTDLNVMTRRAAADHALRAIEADAVVAGARGIVTLLVAAAPLRLRCGAEEVALAMGEALWLEAAEAARVVDGRGFVVTIRPA